VDEHLSTADVLAILKTFINEPLVTHFVSRYAVAPRTIVAEDVVQT
jgi:hypothetical protein